MTSSSSLPPFSRGAIGTQEIRFGEREMARREKLLTAVHELVVIEHGLREGLSLGSLSEIGGETEGFGDGQIRPDSEHGRL